MANSDSQSVRKLYAQLFGEKEGEPTPLRMSEEERLERGVDLQQTEDEVTRVSKEVLDLD